MAMKKYEDPRFELVSYELFDVLTISGEDAWLGDDVNGNNDNIVGEDSIF